MLYIEAFETLSSQTRINIFIREKSSRVGAEKNGGCGCGNLMENNAQENAPLAEGATAA
ncbi:hypothetical protein F2Q68_00043325 [Brassica cretica]|uniref:Uncharacterized protein n=1 Tax=Brassica cretica TaxID=69181 RepID=A0A8S9LRC1_BRACR|nr:hypothetical protein F2Q68_00043325 [Brassica cretica]